MNMQAILKQAQSMQKDMAKAQGDINNTVFVGESSLVKIEMKGNHTVVSVKINSDSSIDSDEIELIEDMIVIATNNAIDKINKMTEEKMGKFSNMPGMPGLF